MKDQIPDIVFYEFLLILLMFFGRVGGLTLIYATISTKRNNAKLPMEKIMVG